MEVPLAVGVELPVALGVCVCVAVGDSEGVPVGVQVSLAVGVCVPVSEHHPRLDPPRYGARGFYDFNDVPRSLSNY